MNVTTTLAGKRSVSVTVVDRKDHSKAFLRILAKGDVARYISEIREECKANNPQWEISLASTT